MISGKAFRLSWNQIHVYLRVFIHKSYKTRLWWLWKQANWEAAVRPPKNPVYIARQLVVYNLINCQFVWDCSFPGAIWGHCVSKPCFEAWIIADYVVLTWWILLIKLTPCDWRKSGTKCYFSVGAHLVSGLMIKLRWCAAFCPMESWRQAGTYAEVNTCWLEQALRKLYTKQDIILFSVGYFVVLVKCSHHMIHSLFADRIVQHSGLFSWNYETKHLPAPSLICWYLKACHWRDSILYNSIWSGSGTKLLTFAVSLHGRRD